MPDSGEIVFWCKDPRRQIGVQLQTTPFFRGLTVAENLILFANFYGVHLGRQQVIDLLARCGLAEVMRTEASKLSGGQQKRLAIALTLAHQPRLIFLDEPTAALDPRARREIRELIRSLAMLNNIVTLPMIFSSATFYSLTYVPAWIKTISHILPFSYMIDAEHAALAGNTAGLVFPLLILLAFTVLALILAIITFRWDPNTPPIRFGLRGRATTVKHSS